MHRALALTIVYGTFLTIVLARADAFAADIHEDFKVSAPTVGSPSLNFAQSSSISGNTMVVGALGEDCAAGSSCGTAHVYEFIGTAWVHRAELMASDAQSGDQLGFSVAISGDTIVAGAPGDDCDVNSSCGSAYVFVKPKSGWVDMTESFKLTIPMSAGVGGRVTIEGNTIVVSAVRPSLFYISLIVFQFNGVSWVKQAELTAADKEGANSMGEFVSISGNTIATGAPSVDCVGGSECGKVYVFVKPASGWIDMTQTARLSPSDGFMLDKFGESVSIDGDTIVVGSNSGSTQNCGAVFNCGAAYVFEKPAGGWVDMTETAKITDSDVAAHDSFGDSVFVAGDTIIVGATGFPFLGPNIEGAAFVFVKPAGGWANMTETAKLSASDGFIANRFGASVSMSGSTIVVGAPGDDSAYFFHCPLCPTLTSTGIGILGAMILVGGSLVLRRRSSRVPRVRL